MVREICKHFLYLPFLARDAAFTELIPQDGLGDRIRPFVDHVCWKMLTGGYLNRKAAITITEALRTTEASVFNEVHKFFNCVHKNTSTQVCIKGTS